MIVICFVGRKASGWRPLVVFLWATYNPHPGFASQLLDASDILFFATNTWVVHTWQNIFACFPHVCL
jgi:hypothetical protein